MTSTDTGHVNPQNQRVNRRVGPSPALDGQYTYELECLRPRPDGATCGWRYGANGPDIEGAVQVPEGGVPAVRVVGPEIRFEEGPMSKVKQTDAERRSLLVAALQAEPGRRYRPSELKHLTGVSSRPSAHF